MHPALATARPRAHRHPQPPWRKITGTRDYIAHGYDRVAYDVIWGVLDVETSKLKTAVLAILAAEFPEPPAHE